MRLSLNVNGTSRVIAAVDGPGYLTAHLNLYNRPKENDDSKTVGVSGIETHETETIYFYWPTAQLGIGDEVHIRILDDGQGDAPTRVRKSSEAPLNLFSNRTIASELLNVVAEFESRVMEIVRKSEDSESEDEHKKFTTAVTHVATDIAQKFLYPVYRRHPELVPDELKGELL
jgi:hypothetical protein